MSVQQAGTDIRVLRELEGFPLAEALFGRRSRRFARGAMGGTTCVAREAQYVFDTFGKFPGTVPSVFIMNYVQAHHLDPGFTTGSSNPANTCAHTPSTCNAGHAGPEGV